MSEFAHFQFPIFNMGGVREDIVAPMPTARVVGKWAGTPEGTALLQQYAPEIAHHVAALRQHYYTGTQPMVRKLVDTPSYRMEYVMHEGKELISIEPRPTPSVPVPPLQENPPDVLLIEVLWESNNDVESIPYWYPSGNHWIRGVKIGDTVPFPWGFVCGPTSATINGYPFFGAGTGNIPPFYCDTPPYPGQHAAVGFSTPYQFIWKNTSDALWYSGGGYGGGAPYPVEITAAGPDACNGTQTGVIPLPAIPGPYTEPWSTPMYDELGNLRTREILTRWKGYKDIDPHRLLVRAQIVGGDKDGEYAGANGGNSTNFPEDPADWDSYDPYGIIPAGEPYWQGRLFYWNEVVIPTPLAQEWLDARPAEVGNGHTVALDTRYYRKEVNKEEVTLDLFGFWRNPRHSRNRRGDPYRPGGTEYWTAPDGRSSVPNANFSGPVDAEAYLMSLIDTTWYTEPTPPISARPVKVIATWVWGIRGSDDPLTEVTSNLSDYAQKSIDFDLTGSTPPAVVTAYQTSHNDPAVVNELPWGTRIGRLKADFETLAISLTFPDEV